MHLVNYVPPEVLCVIFEHVRGSGGHTLASYSPLNAVMLVCRKWYDVARGHGALWNDITLELTPKRGLSVPRWDAHLLEWSKTASIDLRLEFSYLEIAQCEAVLLKHGDRVRHLELFTACVASVHELPRMLGLLASASHLTHLTLSLPNPMEMGTPRVRRQFASLPSLRVLVLDRVIWFPFTPLLALATVHLIGVQPFLVDDLSPLSTEAPNLTTLQLTACTLDRCRVISNTLLALPHVRTLAFARTAASTMREVLARLNLPAVEDIQVDRLSLDVDPGLGQPILSKPLALEVSDPLLRLDVLAPSFFHGHSGLQLSFAAEGRHGRITLDAAPRGETEWNEWAAAWTRAVPTLLSTHALTSCRLRLSLWARESLLGFAVHVPRLRHLVVQPLAESSAVTMVEALNALLRRDVCLELVSVGIVLPSARTNCLPGLIAGTFGRAEEGRRLRCLLVCTTAGSGAVLGSSTQDGTLTEHLLRYVDRVEFGCSAETLWPGAELGCSS